MAATTSPSLGQVLVDTVDDTAYLYDLSTAPSLAVGDEVVVVMGTHQLTMFDNAFPLGTPVEVDYGPTLPDGGFPFKPVLAANPSIPQYPSLIFPCADYDPYDGGRIWMMYGEHLTPDFASPPETYSWCYPILHLAVQKDPALSTPAGFSTSDWWYYTGDPAPMGGAGDAFDLGLPPGSGGPARFDSSVPDTHGPLKDNLVLPRFAFDEDVIVVATTERGTCTELESGGGGLGAGEQALLIIPRTHDSGAKSILDGDRPAESDITLARLRDFPLVFDNSFHNCPVQEPLEQEDNAMLFISTTGGVSADVTMLGIRLKGLFKDAGGTWQIRQQLQGSPGSYSLLDMPVGSSLHYRASTASDVVETPTGFEPTVEGTFFTSAVLTKDAANNDRVFAVHAVLPPAGTSNPKWRVQWYVIDPKLSDLRDTNVLNTNWQPEIVASGQITTDGDENQGHCYHPVMGVSRTGTAYIEYTFSSATVEHRIIRATLNSGYTGVSAWATRKLGPSLGYSGERWALFGDMQHDPNRCLLWSTHTLVHDGNGPSGAIDERDAWLMTTGYNCFQTDLNADGVTDPYDMMIYSDYYMQGDERADTNGDAVIEPTDMANYISAYDAATQP